MSEEMVSMMDEFKKERDSLIELMHAEVQDNILLNCDSQDDFDPY